MKYSCLALGVCVSVSSMMTGGAARAQAVTADANSLQEVVVTAQRRSERLQDVPIAVAVLSAADLAQTGAFNTMTMDTQIPTLQASHQTSGTTIFLRGVGTIASPGIENAVANYIDDVYVNGFSGGIISFNNIERIEVLEGPQGTLFGRNATGGVLHIVTKDPSATPSVSAQFGFGNYETFTTSLYGTTAIVDNLAADIAFESRDQRNGWGHDVTTNQQINLGKEWAFRTKWKWTPTENTSITAAIDHYYDDYDYGINETVVPGSLSAGNATFTGVYNSQGNNLYSHNPDGPGASGHALHVDGHSITIEHDFSWSVFKAITARRHTGDYVSYDQDAGPGHYNDARWPYSLTQFSQELRLSSPNSSQLFGHTWKWLTGLYYLTDPGLPCAQYQRRGLRRRPDHGCRPALQGHGHLLYALLFGLHRHHVGGGAGHEPDSRLPRDRGSHPLQFEHVLPGAGRTRFHHGVRLKVLPMRRGERGARCSTTSSCPISWRTCRHRPGSRAAASICMRREARRSAPRISRRTRSA